MIKFVRQTRLDMTQLLFYKKSDKIYVQINVVSAKTGKQTNSWQTILDSTDAIELKDFINNYLEQIKEQK